MVLVASEAGTGWSLDAYVMGACVFTVARALWLWVGVVSSELRGSIACFAFGTKAVPGLIEVELGQGLCLSTVRARLVPRIGDEWLVVYSEVVELLEVDCFCFESGEVWDWIGCFSFPDSVARVDDAVLSSAGDH